jgi:hypothetical protein
VVKRLRWSLTAFYAGRQMPTCGQFGQGAFEANGTPSPAPEPSGLALACVAAAGAAGYAGRLPRRRK